MASLNSTAISLLTNLINQGISQSVVSELQILATNSVTFTNAFNQFALNNGRVVVGVGNFAATFSGSYNRPVVNLIVPTTPPATITTKNIYAPPGSGQSSTGQTDYAALLIAMIGHELGHFTDSATNPLFTNFASLTTSARVLYALRG